MRRREFLGTAALGALVRPGAAAAGVRRRPPGDRIGIGMIGVGGFGMANLNAFLANDDAEVRAICDVYRPHLDRAVARAGGRPRACRDYRALLDDPDIDAVVITTPEHWHAIMCIDACEAGKDVYVEKPASHFIREGRLMVEAARRHGRVVQVGTQQRSGTHFQRAVAYVREGRIGDVHYAACWNHSPRAVARPPAGSAPPPDLDWDLWLGPGPELPYAELWGAGRRNFWRYWGGMITEWGTHLADIVLWALAAGGPRSVVAAGGRFHRREGELPDTLQVTYEYPAFLFHYSVLHHSTYGLNGNVGAARFGSYGMQFQGTRGTLFIDREGFRITPQTTRHEESQPPPRPGTTDRAQPAHYYTTEILAEEAGTSVQHGPHVRNFLDSVKSRARPAADIEAGHLANTVCRLGNIAYRVGRRLVWDAANEEVVGDAEANRLVVGTYRSPWTPRGL